MAIAHLHASASLACIRAIHACIVSRAKTQHKHKVWGTLQGAPQAVSLLKDALQGAPNLCVSVGLPVSIAGRGNADDEVVRQTLGRIARRLVPRVTYGRLASDFVCAPYGS